MIRVTVEDLSGEQPPGSATIEDDYLVTCAGSCYLAEFSFRHTYRKESDTERMARLVGRTHGRRLAYRKPAAKRR